MFGETVNFDRSQKLFFLLLVAAIACLSVMALFNTPFVMASRGGSIQVIPLSWVFPLAFFGMAVPIVLRNLGGLLAVASAGLISGGTMFAGFCIESTGGDLVVSWTQILLGMFVLLAAVAGVARMDVDVTNIALDDLLN